ncbi:MAG: ABC transporter ATP-binding protein/permease, partial [Cyanobium sp.]
MGRRPAVEPSEKGSTPSLLRLGADLERLSARFLFPPAGLAPPLRLALLGCAIVLALAATALLVSGFAALVVGLLGEGRRQLIFPYLTPVLRWADHGRNPALGAAAGAAALAGLLLAGRRLEPAQRRRWWALCVLLALQVTTTAVDVAFTEGNGAVMDALNRRSAGAFWGTAAGLLAVEVLCLPLQYLNSYGQRRWALAWRRSRTAELQARYLSGQAYYRLQADPALNQRLDNPDQRIADDVETAVAGATTLAFGFFTALLALVAYLLVLWSISSTLLLALALASLAGNLVIGRQVRRLAMIGFRQQALEADYRFALVHVRNNAESLAFLRGERAVATGLGRRFATLLVNLERLIRWRSLVEQSSGLYAFLMQFVPYLVLSTAYFSGRVTLGDLTVGSIAFAQVQGALSFLIDRADTVSSVSASLRRGAELEEALAVSAAERSQHPAPALTGVPAAAAPAAPAQVSARPKATPPPTAASGTALVLRLDNLQVAHPAGGPALLDGLSLTLAAGERLLISGPSGCGKTSLLRVLCGLAEPAAGTLTLPPLQAILCLPQHPFLPLGSLREALLFPASSEHGTQPDDPSLHRLLAAAGLQELSRRYPDLAMEEEWSRVLSLGEQQRLGFARLLWQKPALAILDEGSSALDLQAEAR